MYELISVNQRDHYIESPSKIGIVRVGEGDVIIIDTGLDKGAGSKVRRILDDRRWRPIAIYNTHFHADHVGGNAYLQKQYGCPVYAPPMEDAFIRTPILEPSLLWAGYPSKDLRGKFLLAQESTAQPLTPDVLPKGFSLLPLPGHSFNMMGILTPDGTAYIGDCVASEGTLDKYKLCFLYNVEEYLATLDTLSEIKATCFVPSHAAATEDILPLARYNTEAVHAIEDTICQMTEAPVTFEALLRSLFLHYGLTMTYEQYVLIGSTVRSYLSHLKDTDRITLTIADGQLLWQSVSR